VRGRDRADDGPRVRSRPPRAGYPHRLWRERGLTLILVTHDSAVARRAQRIGTMKSGCLSIRQDIRA
jgi:hypothetical protein